MRLDHPKRLALVLLILSVVLAGCFGVLGDEAGPTTPTATAGGVGTATPTISTPTPTTTATSTPTPTPTATATPAPEYLDYGLFADQLAHNLDTAYRDDPWVRESSGNSEEGYVSVVVEKPSEWTIQDTEMEFAREVARASAFGARETVQEAREDGVFVRPDEFRAVIVNEDGERLSMLSISGETAADYAKGETKMSQYADHVTQERTVFNGSMTLSEREPELALRAAEYRAFQKVHLQQIENDTLGDYPPPEIERAEMLVEEKTLYYEYTLEPDDYELAHSASVTRTYLEAIKRVHEQKRVNRLPVKMVLYQDRSWSSEDRSILTTAQTNWTFEYFAITDWQLPQDITMSDAALDAYINRISENRKFIEDDDDYDYVNETVRDTDS